MEKAAEVLLPPQPDKMSPPLDPESSEGEVATSRGCASSFDHMEEFHRRLEDIISTYGSAIGLQDKPSVVEAEMEKMKEEEKGDITVSMDTDISLIMQSLNNLSSAEQKLEDLVRKYAEMAVLRRCDEQRLCVLQQKLSILLEERKQLQAERRSGVAARSKLETLCRELQTHYNVMREETLQRCKEDEEKRKEITSHFQTMLTEIQTQIEQHSARNDKLCHENTHLTEKLESLMNQCERREESLEKINKHRDLQHQLTEAKLQQANALLAEAEDKHKREKEYLLVQAAEWKLQTQTLREQGTVMQAQLTLYAQKFDEFQATLAKSNEIYVRFKKEMDNMSDKMKKMDKESNLWKTRFENCNKALTDMIEERAEKSKEYDLFVLKIQKLEKLCHALQDERKVLYDKIKEVRLTNANIPGKYLGTSNLNDSRNTEGADKSALLTAEELQELQELQADDPVLTEDMSRLREEQTKLQHFAASLLATPSDDEKDKSDDSDLEEDDIASVFGQFKTKTQVKKDVVSVPEQMENVKSQAAESDLPLPVKVEEIQNPVVPTPEAATPEQTTADTMPPEPNLKVQTEVQVAEMQQVQPSEKIQQQQPVAPEPEKAEVDPSTEATKAEVQEETGEVKPMVMMDEQKAQQQPAEPEEAPNTSTSAPPPANTPETAASSEVNSSKKQAPKKKKKRNGKNAS
ncbi:beta-taxilin-like isoform X2 [Acanthochromis polyacanthus]|uniref:beta-taxilin-like isoform X2 n=1 Tax=Acanthochromis polyacanthus TaxID=80966 RepID=UPI000B8EEB63|nr:beta-taxilin-like isoform X2 [Acanthochromis polyacanthus]